MKLQLNLSPGLPGQRSCSGRCGRLAARFALCGATLALLARPLAAQMPPSPDAGAPPPPAGPPDVHPEGSPPPPPGRLLDDIREVRPDLVERLLDLHDRDSAEFRVEVRRLLSTWQVLSVLREHDPAQYQALIELWKANDPRFDEELRKQSSRLRIPRPRWPFPPGEGGPPDGGPGPEGRGEPGKWDGDRHDMRSWRSSPMGKLDQQIRDLQQRWQATDEPDQRGELQAQLREALGQMADLRAQFYADRIAYLEKELERLKELVARRQATREELIASQLAELLAEPPPPPAAAPAPPPDAGPPCEP